MQWTIGRLWIVALLLSTDTFSDKTTIVGYSHCEIEMFVILAVVNAVEECSMLYCQVTYLAVFINVMIWFDSFYVRVSTITAI